MNWLLSGEGDIYLNTDTVNLDLTIDEKILLNNYRTMNDYKKEELQNVTIELVKDIDVNNDEDILLEDFRDMSAEEQEQFKKYAAKILATDKDKKKISISKNMEGEDIATKEDKIA